MLSGRVSRAVTPRLHPWAAEYLSRVCHVEEICNTNRDTINNAENKYNTRDNNVTKRESLVSNIAVPPMESLPALQKVNVSNIKCSVVNNNASVDKEEILDKNNTVNERRGLTNTHLHSLNFESGVKQELFDHLHWRLETRLISKQNTQQHEREVNKTIINNSNNNSCYDINKRKNNTRALAEQIEEANTSKKCIHCNSNASTLQNRSNNYTATQTPSSSSSSLPQMSRSHASLYNVSLQELNDMLINMVHHRKDVFVKPAVGCATMVFVCNQIISSIMRHAMQFATCKIQELHQYEMSTLECAKEIAKEEDMKKVEECVHNTKNNKSCIIASSADKFNESNQHRLLAVQKNKAKINVLLENTHRSQEHQTPELGDNFCKSIVVYNVHCSCNNGSSSSRSECIEGDEEDDSVRLHVIAARYSLHALILPAIQTELRKTLWGAAQNLHRKIVHECKVNLLYAARRERVTQYNNNKNNSSTMQNKFTTTTTTTAAVDHTTEMKSAKGEGRTGKRFIDSGVNTNQLPEEMNSTEQTSKETINKTRNNKTYRSVQEEEEEYCEKIKEINSFLQRHYKLSLEQLIDDLFTFPISLYNITPERLSNNESRLSVSLHNSDKMLFYPPLHRVYFDFTTRSTLLCGQMRKPRADKLLPLYFAASTNLFHRARNTQCNNSTQEKKETYNYNKESQKNYADMESTNLFHVLEWRDILWVSLCEMSQLRICISFLLQLEYILFDAKHLVNGSVHAANTENKISTRYFSATAHGNSDRSKDKQEERQNKEQNKESNASISKINSVKAIDFVLRLLKLLNARLDGHLWKETHFKRFCRKCQISEKSELSCVSSEEEEELQNTVIGKEEDDLTCNTSDDKTIAMSKHANKEQIYNDKYKYKQHEQIRQEIKPHCTVKTHYASVQELHTAFMHAIKSNNNRSSNNNNNNITPQSSKTSCNFAIKDDNNNVVQKQSDFTNISNSDSNNESNKEYCDSTVSNKMFVKVKSYIGNADGLSKVEEEKSEEVLHNKTITSMQTSTTTHIALIENNNERRDSESSTVMQEKQKEYEQQITTQRQQSKQPQNKATSTLKNLPSSGQNNNNFFRENCSKAKSRDDLFLEELLSSTTRPHQSWPSSFESKNSSWETRQATSSPPVTHTESQKRSTSVTRRINKNNANNKHCRRSTQHEENVFDKR